MMKRVGLVLLSVLSIIGLWAVVAAIGDYPTFILPSPGLVSQRAVTAWSHGNLASHIAVTLAETLGGFAISALLALVLGYLAASFGAVRRVISPYLLTLQAIPVLAVAPLLVIWFGSGYLTKVIVAGLVCFLPIFASSLAAFSGIDETWRLDMRALGGDRRQTFGKLELPAALPGIMNGMKVGLSLALMGAVVGEFVGAQRGLGYLINLAKGLLDTPLVFVAIVVLVAIGLSLYGLMSWLTAFLLKQR